jgi:hypothetical protein
LSFVKNLTFVDSNNRLFPPSTLQPDFKMEIKPIADFVQFGRLILAGSTTALIYGRGGGGGDGGSGSLAAPSPSAVTVVQAKGVRVESSFAAGVRVIQVEEYSGVTANQSQVSNLHALANRQYKVAPRLTL